MPFHLREPIDKDHLVRLKARASIIGALDEVSSLCFVHIAVHSTGVLGIVFHVIEQFWRERFCQDMSVSVP